MHAAVVELDALSDPVGSAAENNHLLPVARIGLASRRIETVVFVRGVEVWGEGREFGRASVDALINRPQIVTLATGEYVLLSETCQFRKTGVGEAHLLQAQKSGAIVRKAIFPD